MATTPDIAPLTEIESSVLQRAKDINLDLAGSEGFSGLRALIDDEIVKWNEDHKRGLRPFELADVHRLGERAFRNLAGYGPLTELLSDDDVWEVIIIELLTCHS